MDVNGSTPIAMLTVDQLREAFSLSDGERGMNKVEEKPRAYVFGLAGIRQLFGVSHVTAHRYKNTILRDAVSQQGRVIVVDVEKAMELFKNSKR